MHRQKNDVLHVAKKVQVEMGKFFLRKILEARPRARAVPGAAGRRGELSWTRQNFFGEDQKFSYICICARIGGALHPLAVDGEVGGQHLHMHAYVHV